MRIGKDKSYWLRLLLMYFLHLRNQKKIYVYRKIEMINTPVPVLDGDGKQLILYDDYYIVKLRDPYPELTPEILDSVFLYYDLKVRNFRREFDEGLFRTTVHFILASESNYREDYSDV